MLKKVKVLWAVSLASTLEYRAETISPSLSPPPPQYPAETILPLFIRSVFKAESRFVFFCVGGCWEGTEQH